MDNTQLKERVLKANEEAHDWGAKNHTRSVPYQSRRITRNYIWSLIISNLKKNKIDAKNKKVLEVACGTGTFVKLFDKLGANSYDGIDISGKMLEIAREQHPQKNVSFYKKPLEEYSKENENKYDIIIASSFLHHLVDLEEGLIQLKKMLIPGGIFIGLHEVINKRDLTKLEVFDNELSRLFGYQGHIQFPNNFKNYLFTKDSEQESNNSNSKQIDYIDYQLNFDFNLSENKIAQKYGEVFPYCYYNFAEFRFIQKTMNHDLFIMKN